MFAMPDPTMPKRIPPAIERELRVMLHEYRVRPSPVDVYLTIRDALEAELKSAEPRPKAD